MGAVSGLWQPLVNCTTPTRWGVYFLIYTIYSLCMYWWMTFIFMFPSWFHLCSWFCHSNVTPHWQSEKETRINNFWVIRRIINNFWILNSFKNINNSWQIEYNVLLLMSTQFFNYITVMKKLYYGLHFSGTFCICV